jgi:hypothetical protein
MGGFSFYVGTVVFVLLCFAYAYGLIAAGIWAWAAFLIVAGTCLVLAALVAGIAYLKVKKLSGLRLTKKTVTEDLAMLRREDQQPPISPDGDHAAISRDGQRAGIAARETK